MPRTTRLVYSPEDALAVTEFFSVLFDLDEEDAKPTPPQPEKTPPVPAPTKPEDGPLVSAAPKPAAEQSTQTATGFRRSRPENSAMTTDRSEVARFVSAFGPRGATYFLEGKTFGEARKAYLLATKEERKAMWTRGMTKSMARFAMGCKPPGKS